MTVRELKEKLNTVFNENMEVKVMSVGGSDTWEDYLSIKEFKILLDDANRMFVRIVVQ